MTRPDDLGAMGGWIPSLVERDAPATSWSRTNRPNAPVRLVDEVLAKMLCHNLSCLIHATEEFGIDPDFGGKIPKCGPADAV